jgi:hypothetical protein
MSDKVDTFLWILAIGVILITLANPGGLIIGLLVAFVILGSRYGLPFVGDLVRQRQSGVGRAKVTQGARNKLRRDNRGDDK